MTEGTLPFRIVVDTRERKPYFEDLGDEDVIHKKLDTGDYSIEGFENLVAVERKSLNDLIRSISVDRDRFLNEIIRGNDLAGFIVVIESTRGHVGSGNYYSKMHPNAIFGTLSAWEANNDVQFVWATNRDGGEAETLEQLTKWWNGELLPMHF